MFLSDKLPKQPRQMQQLVHHLGRAPVAVVSFQLQLSGPGDFAGPHHPLLALFRGDGPFRLHSMWAQDMPPEQPELLSGSARLSSQVRYVLAPRFCTASSTGGATMRLWLS